MKKDLLKILNLNKFEDDYAGPYPYSNEEKAKMIINYLKNEGYKRDKK